MKRYATAVIWILLAAAPAAAHHAFGAEFDAAKPLRLRGTVSKLEWVNPHAWIYIEVKKPDGNTETWMIETANPNSLVRLGLTKDTLKLGADVVVNGYQSKNGSPRVSGRDVVLPNGQLLLLRPSDSGAPVDNTIVVSEDRRVVRTQVAGAWWANAALMQRLELTDDQKAKLERTFENHRLAIVSTTAQLEKEEAQLERLLAADPLDRNAVLSQIDRVVQARSEMERANSAMTLEMREHLTRAQWLQLPRTNLTIQMPAAPLVPGQRRGRGQ
jgi:uncharacterized protein DUF6152/heavy-metal resistance protein